MPQLVWRVAKATTVYKHARGFQVEIAMIGDPKWRGLPQQIFEASPSTYNLFMRGGGHPTAVSPILSSPTACFAWATKNLLGGKDPDYAQTKPALPVIHAYRVAKATYPQVWTKGPLEPGDSYTCSRAKKKPYSIMALQTRKMFPFINERVFRGVEPLKITSDGFSLTASFSTLEGWTIPTWETEMAVTQAWILEAYKQKLLDESFARSRYNRLTKIVNLGLNAGTQGEKQGAISAASRVLLSLQERTTKP